MRRRLLSILLLIPNWAYAMEQMDCFGTEPFWDATLAGKQIAIKFMRGKTTNYSKAKYTPAANTDGVVSIQAGSGTSTLTAFVVDATRMMFVLDKNGKEVVATEYTAYCSDGMSPLGHPYSIHLILDGKAYTGCCSTASKPSVGR
jgi:uncharacterized membrane protein